MKRESINSNESQLNDDMLHPLIDDMLARRREALEEVNKMFGTNITVDFNGAWLTNEKEEELTLDQMETATDQMSEEVTPDEESIEDNDIDTSNNSVQDTNETGPDTEEEVEETVEETDTTEVVDAIENAAEVIADAIEGDTPEDDNKEGEEHQRYYQYCKQSHRLVDYIELQVLALKSDVMAYKVNELTYGLYVFVAREHTLLFCSLFSYIFCSLLDVVCQINNLLTREVDVVLLAEIVYSVSNFLTCVSAFFRCY
jgi:hypothetical protein